MPRWPDDVVLAKDEVLTFPKPRMAFRSKTAWLATVIEADWLFRHGYDTVDISRALGLYEAEALQAVIQGREARRKPTEDDQDVTSEVGSTAKIIPGGGSQP